jgi:adenylate kinase family enzyme
MKKIIVFGNSASGKSSLAKKLSLIHSITHLDLDILAWQEGSELPQRRALDDSLKDIDTFINNNDEWVIEGCYGDLLSLISERAEQAYFLNLPIAACIENAKKRPWEPHKYESKQAQDANLGMLIDWIRNYEERQDSFSQEAHTVLFESFKGEKTMLISND